MSTIALWKYEFQRQSRSGPVLYVQDRCGIQVSEQELRQVLTIIQPSVLELNVPMTNPLHMFQIRTLI